MIHSVQEDRLARLRRRGEVLFRDMTRTSRAHRQLLEHAWHGALDATDGPFHASRLDAILCLLERITRPSKWLDEQATWFNRAQVCLLDAVSHTGSAAVPPPILAVEPIESPLYVPRAQAPGAWLSQATPAHLPLPVVMCPGNLLEEPWGWATLFHEVGHHLDAALGDTRDLLPRLRRAENDLDVDLGSWSAERWLGEVIADLYAGLLGGPGAVDALCAVFTTKPYSGSHPSDADRAAILRAAFTGVRDGQPPSGTAPTDLVTRALVERFSHWRARVQDDCARSEQAPSCARLVPGSLFQKLAGGATAAALREACDGLFDTLSLPDWVPTQAHLDTLAGAMRNLVETRVQPGRDPLKVPRMDLLVRHDRVAFVGATHGQLLPKLRDALALRKQPYRRIEIFALADEPLRELVLDGKSGQALIEERDRSLAALHDYLAAERVPHHVYIYSQPYVFASFWDAEQDESPPPGVPVHIHLSNALWGLDVRRAPGHDLEAPAGELPTSMQTRIEALANLRRSSTEIRRYPPAPDTVPG